MRPSKRVFSLTSKGKKPFLSGLQIPVEHIRDLRIEFLAKLFFFQSFSLDAGHELIKAQESSLEDTIYMNAGVPRKSAFRICKQCLMRSSGACKNKNLVDLERIQRV